MTKKCLELKGVSKNFQGFRLNHISFTLPQGYIMGLVGSNGAGKTTLLRILTGRTRQTSGKIELFGKSYRKDLDIQRGKVGAIIETPALYPGMTAKITWKSSACNWV